MGLLQGLARHKLLSRFHFLSTVSGGGYIGSWLSAWINRHPKGLDGVTAELANANPLKKIDPDPDPLHYLRQYSSFITPKTGLLSADTWSFIGIYLRNLSLNWMVFIPLIISVLTIPRLLLTMTLAQAERDELKPIISKPFGLADFSIYGRHLFLLGGFVLGIWALAYIIFNRPGVREELQHVGRVWRNLGNQRGFLWCCLLPLVLSAVCLTTYWAWSRETSERTKPAFVFLLFGLAFTFLGWVLASLVLRRRLREFIKPELFALLLAGAVGGLIFWLISQNSLGDPVVGYGNIAGTGKGFPWTSWANSDCGAVVDPCTSRSTWSWLNWTTEIYTCLGVPLFLLAFLLAATVFVGFSSRAKRIQDEDREWWARMGAWILIVIIGWTVANSLVLFGPIALLTSPKLLGSLGGISGLIAVLAGRSSVTKANPESANGKDDSKIGRIMAMATQSLTLLAAIFIGILIAAFSLATTGVIQLIGRLFSDAPTNNKWVETLNNVPVNRGGFQTYLSYIYPNIDSKLDAFTGVKIVHMNVLHHTSFWLVLALGLIALAVGLLVSRSINLNLFSLHAGYRNRFDPSIFGGLATRS